MLERKNDELFRPYLLRMVGTRGKRLGPSVSLWRATLQGFLSVLFLCGAREQHLSRMPTRSFPSACPWMSSCVSAEGFQRGREMPSKIVFETEDSTMEETVDTVAEHKTLKVSRVKLVARNEPNISCGSGADLLPRLLPCLTTCG